MEEYFIGKKKKPTLHFVKKCKRYKKNRTHERMSPLSVMERWNRILYRTREMGKTLPDIAQDAMNTRITTFRRRLLKKRVAFLDVWVTAIALKVSPQSLLWDYKANIKNELNMRAD